MKKKNSSRPNILIIHCDQLRYDGIGCNRNEYAVTPNIDQLAQEGTQFHRHISCSPVCVPSRTSFFTGLYPHATNILTNGMQLPRSSYLQDDPRNADMKEGFAITHIPTMPDWFHEHGYATCSIGKLHLTPTNAPRSMNTEESRSVWAEGVMDDWRGPYYGFQHVEMSNGHGEGTRGHYRLWLKENYPEVFKQLESGEHLKEKPFPFECPDELYPSVIPEEAHHSTWIAKRTREYLKNRKDSDQPFFLFTGLPTPPDIQGSSIIPVLGGEQTARNPMVICAQPKQYTHNQAIRNYSIYDERFRMTLYPDTGERELYDHASDPHELNNLAEDPEYVAITERLHRLLLDRVLETHRPTFGRVCRN